MEIWLSFIALLTEALKYLYGLAGSYGIAIIIFTIIVRVLFLPLSIKSTKSMREMQANQAKLKPQLEALKKKYGNDRQRLMEEQTKLYKEHGINPMAGLGGCLPLLIQMPIWIALYSALLGLSHTPEFATQFLWISNLGQKEDFPYLLAIFTGGSQWVLSRMMAQPAADDQQKTMNSMMQIMMPAMMVFFAFQVPAGLVLYWATNNIFQFFQQLFTTGWGELRPSRKADATTAAPTVTPKKASAAAEQPRPERAERAERRESHNGRLSGDGRAGGSYVLPDSSSALKDGLRIYTLEPEHDDGGDYAADGPSQSMEESIARAKGQAKARKKKRRS